VYVRHFPDAASGLVQVSTDGGHEPVWAHNGRELFYRSADNEMVAVEVNGDPTFTAGRQEVLFSMDGYMGSNGNPMYDVSRDDQRFVMLSVVVGRLDTSELLMVQNFDEELKRLLPN